MRSAFFAVARFIIGYLAVLALIVLLTVTLQHLRKGSAEEVLMGQRGSALSTPLIEKTLATKFEEFLRDLPSITVWKSLRGTPVFPQIGDALGATSVLTALSLLFSVLIATLLLLLEAVRPRLSTTLLALANAVNTTPIFLIGIVFIWFFALALRLLPSGGDESLRFFVLPALSIAAKFGARLFLLLSNYLAEVEKKKFILRARAFALSERRLFFHKLANCTMPFLIFWLIETASLFSGAVIVETLFTIHGLGSLLLFALLQYDIRLIFTNLIVIATIVYLTSVIQNFIAERSSHST